MCLQTLYFIWFLFHSLLTRLFYLVNIIFQLICLLFYSLFQLLDDVFLSFVFFPLVKVYLFLLLNLCLALLFHLLHTLCRLQFNLLIFNTKTVKFARLFLFTFLLLLKWLNLLMISIHGFIFRLQFLLQVTLVLLHQLKLLVVLKCFLFQTFNLF